MISTNEIADIYKALTNSLVLIKQLKLSDNDTQQCGEWITTLIAQFSNLNSLVLALEKKDGLEHKLNDVADRKNNLNLASKLNNQEIKKRISEVLIEINTKLNQSYSSVVNKINQLLALIVSGNSSFSSNSIFTLITSYVEIKNFLNVMTSDLSFNIGLFQQLVNKNLAPISLIERSLSSPISIEKKASEKINKKNVSNVLAEKLIMTVPFLPLSSINKDEEKKIKKIRRQPVPIAPRPPIYKNYEFKKKQRKEKNFIFNFPLQPHCAINNNNAKKSDFSSGETELTSVSQIMPNSNINNNSSDIPDRQWQLVSNDKHNVFNQANKSGQLNFVHLEKSTQNNADKDSFSSSSLSLSLNEKFI